MTTKPSTKSCPCGAPISARWLAPVSFGGQEIIEGAWDQPDLCPACVKAKIEEQKRSENAKARRELEARCGLADGYFQGIELKDFSSDTAARARVAEKIRPLYKRAVGAGPLPSVFLSGDSGTGKTFVAAGLLRIMCARGVKVLFCSVPELVLRLRERAVAGTIVYELDRMVALEALCLDDLGSEKVTDWVGETIALLIDMWYRKGKPGLIVTSNLTLDKIASIYGDRVASRLAGMCQVIDFAGCPDGRQKKEEEPKLI